MFSSTIRLVAAAGFFAWAALSFPGSAAAQDADMRDVQRYVLTSAGLARYTLATKNLAALPAAQARACEEDGDDDDDADAQSIGDMVAKLESVPGAKAAVQGAGLTMREYVVFTMSLLQNGLAAWAVTQPGGKLPPGVSKANVEFVQAHDADLKQLQQYSRNDDCADIGEDTAAADDGVQG
jgi:hypothetical protein